MLHTINNYLFVQHHFHRTIILVHNNSHLQYFNSKLTSPKHVNYSYIINSTHCEGTLHNFNPIKNYFFFLPLYAKTHKPKFVEPQSVCMGTLLISSKGTGWWTSWQISNQDQRKHRSTTTSWRCSFTATLTYNPVHLPETKNFWKVSGIMTIGPLTSNWDSGCRPQSYHIGLKVPQIHRLTVL